MSTTAATRTGQEEETAISEFHVSQLEAFLRFAGVKRAEALRSVDVAFREAGESVDDDGGSRLFAGDDVRSLIAGARDSVRADVQRELVHTAHTTALVLRQLFAQAEDIMLDLHVDVAALENEFLLREVSAHDPSVPQPPGATRLKPLSHAASGSAVQHALDRKQRSDDRFRQLQAQCTEILRAKTALAEELRRLKESQQPRSAASAQQQQQPAVPTAADHGEQQVAALQKEVAELKASVEAERGRCRQAEAELTKRLQATAPFQNLRRMLRQKNDTVRTLRELLRKHAPGVALPGDDTEADAADTADS